MSFDKIQESLPDFSCDWTIERGAHQLRDLFSRIDLSEELFLSRYFTRLKQIQYLLQTEQIDREFYWKPPCDS